MKDRIATGGGSKQFVLIRHRAIDRGLHRRNSTPNAGAVKTWGGRTGVPCLGLQQFVRDIERRHHGDALGARNLP